MKIIQIDPGRAEGLIKELDEYQDSLYPAESNHLDSLDTLRKENVIMLGAVEDDNIMAIGAVKIFSDYGEIKRLFVPQRHRSKGLAKRIMAELEKYLMGKNIGYAKLETGSLQHEAAGLYRTLGYVECHPFGAYRPDPLSLFMSKKL
jgi:putative acetyltransferase